MIIPDELVLEKESEVAWRSAMSLHFMCEFAVNIALVKHVRNRNQYIGNFSALDHAN